MALTKHPAILSLLCLIATTAFHGTAQADIIAIEFGGAVVDIDSSTGAATPVGPSGVNGALNAMARDGGGTLYSAGATGLNNDTNLYTLDALTGLATDVANLSFGAEVVSVRGMAFSAADTLFAVNNGGGLTSTGVTDNLFTVNTTTGVGTLIGATSGFMGIQGLAFSPLDMLFAWDVGAGLLTIDPLTGVATDVNPAVGSTANIQTLAFAPDGTLYGASNDLFTIALATGATTLVGSGGYTDVRGMEFLVNPIPEPQTYTLVALGLALIGFVRRKSSGV